jgi:hexosaminidase
MMQRVKLIFLLAIPFLLSIHTVTSIEADNVQIWPEPVHFLIDSSSSPLYVDPNLFSFSYSLLPYPAIISAAFQRYDELIFGASKSSKNIHNYPVLSSLVVSPAVDLKNYIGIDESYSIHISLNHNQASAVLSAATTIGILRGLESFSQLIDWSFDDSSNSAQYLIHSSNISISDYPRFSWRGVLIDSARHYLEVPTLMRLIDAMSWNKFNIFHW